MGMKKESRCFSKQSNGRKIRVGQAGYECVAIWWLSVCRRMEIRANKSSRDRDWTANVGKKDANCQEIQGLQ